ncbi:MAG TPA: hypothetical protein VI685_22350 [Candidatus Angelobacter sp.]
MHTGVYWQIVYWLSTPALAALGAIFLLRRLFQSFRLFFAYVLIAFLSDVSRLVAYPRSFRVYAYTYWISQLVNTVFAILAISELFLKRLFPQFQKIGFYRSLFSIMAVLLVGLATLTAFHSIPTGILVKILHVLDFLRVATLFFFVGLMVFMGRRWGRYEFGIALGFSVDAAAFLTAFAINTRPGLLRNFAANLPVFAYDIACLIWLITFLKPEKSSPVPTGPLSPEVIEEAQRWEKAARKSWTGKRLPK